ncbi:integrase arm-type DNA-binding domain-containing protein [Xenorhabdus budapestensis]|uniref:Integrase arm-type DNA-binding domain-containing protein n=1 Tax=Xenorhabdus budapestensis TaxID=290110 RepID=A0ABX7VIY4_XENBU|nr:integrase arm-type DNA-binding domain-containing protein [Xenorhabdus budapestensis]
MARQTKPLSVKEIESAKPKEADYVLYDGDGLELLIKSSGSKIWQFRYILPVTKKRAKKSIGSYPSVTLADVRNYRAESRALLAKQIDPQEHQQEQLRSTLEAKTNIFKLVAERWWNVKKTTVSEDYAKDIWRSLEKDIFPKLGATPITNLKAPMLVEVLNPIEARGNLETIKRLTQRTVEIIDYAMNLSVIDANPFTTASKAFPKPKKKHNPTIRPEELHGLIQALSVARVERQTRLVIEWQLLTAMRPREAVKARWSEIDLDNRLWNVPAETMKMDRPHTIPLCQLALDILEIMKPISRHRELVFPHRSATTIF